MNVNKYTKSGELLSRYAEYYEEHWQSYRPAPTSDNGRSKIQRGLGKPYTNHNILKSYLDHLLSKMK